jgi:hypothetical protein
MESTNHVSSESEGFKRLSPPTNDFRVDQSPPQASGIRRRIRMREVLTLSLAALSVGVLVGGIAQANGLPDRNTTAGRLGGTIGMTGRSSAGATSGPWPEVVVGGSGQPFIEAAAGDDRVSLPKQVVSYGTVSGVPWSLTGFWSDGGGSYSDAAGPCAELFLGADGEGGGTAICAQPPVQQDAPSSSSLRMSVLLSSANPGFVAYFGMVPSGAAQVQVRLSSGDVRTFDVLNDVKGLETGYFAFFAPPGIKGDVAVTDGTGSVLVIQSLCGLPAAGANETIGGECR